MIPIKLSEKESGMASGILRVTARAFFLFFLLAVAGILFYFLK